MLKQDLTDFSLVVANRTKKFIEAQKEEAINIDITLVRSLQKLEDFVMRGGKALRPFLVKLGFELAGGQVSERLEIAAASIDLHHKHILILDDIADRDEERYGGPTLEYAYHVFFEKDKDKEHHSRSFAMLDGVWLGALAREMLLTSGFEPQKLLNIIHILNTTMYAQTLAGWQIHMLGTIQPLSKSTPQEFIKGLELVTAKYTFEGPLMIGLMLAENQDDTLVINLKSYAKYVGTAFQIQDDILGLFGESKITGKPVGNDVREGKKTLLLQDAYKSSSNEDCDFLEKVTGKINITSEEIKRVQQIVIDSGALEKSKQMSREMIDEGIASLESLENSTAKENLIELARYVINRDK